MNDEVKKDILNILQKAIESFPVNDSANLRKLSNKTIHTTSIYQDKDSINIAVVVYALSKLIQRNHKKDEILEKLNKAKEFLENNSFEEYEKILAEIVDIIYSYDKKINFYVKHIINQAGIKKGSKIYEHGISLARTAEIFNISQWELMTYLGQTNIPDKQGESGTTLDERLTYTRKLFGIKNE